MTNGILTIEFISNDDFKAGDVWGVGEKNNTSLYDADGNVIAKIKAMRFEIEED